MSDTVETVELTSRTWLKGSLNTASDGRWVLIVSLFRVTLMLSRYPGAVSLSLGHASDPGWAVGVAVGRWTPFEWVRIPGSRAEVQHVRVSLGFVAVEWGPWMGRGER